MREVSVVVVWDFRRRNRGKIGTTTTSTSIVSILISGVSGVECGRCDAGNCTQGGITMVIHLAGVELPTIVVT
jgi:hypothetical protein